MFCKGAQKRLPSIFVSSVAILRIRVPLMILFDINQASFNPFLQYLFHFNSLLDKKRLKMDDKSIQISNISETLKLNSVFSFENYFAIV
jgi:hypothetical protein